ncbi:MAG: NAD(P)-binding protein, partial [Betaproteobacteria bacterium]|nr:NAD(P)-binding protein [Betaproteobacteria bacterium]
MSLLAIVIGASVNELVCAHYLARAGHRVLVLDPRPSREGSLAELGWIPPRIVRELGLDRQGLV